MATINFDKLKAAYKAGLPIRERITNYSPKDMKNAIGNIVNFARLTCASKMKDCENMTANGYLDLKYGNENNQEPDLTSFDFILKEATLMTPMESFTYCFEYTRLTHRLFLYYQFPHREFPEQASGSFPAVSQCILRLSEEE